ncbi:MAG: 4Fe-4S binding protein, partial [Bacillota bacterium]
DGVSGATVTVEGILSAVQKGIIQVGNEQLGLDIPLVNSINLNRKDILVFVLVVFSIVCAAYNFKKIRPWLLVLSVIFIGFTLNYSITYSNYVGLLAGNLPVFIERPIWYVMVPGVLLVTLLFGRNFYCYWLCPFGAVQEGIFKSLNLYNFSPSREIKAKANKNRWPLLWLVAFVALIYNHSGVAGYEPFSVFFSGDGNKAQWAIMVIVLLVSMAQLRFWCRNFCPVGTILDFIAKLKRKIRRLASEHKDLAELSANSSCSLACGSDKDPLTKQDRFYVLLVSAVNILIILSLLQSIGQT